MALVYKDRVKETTTTTGTGTLTLAGAASGYQAFSSVGNANTCVYGLEASDGGWEVGIGTYTLSGTTLARTTILASSNSGSAITLPAGTHNVYVTADASALTANYKDMITHIDGIVPSWTGADTVAWSAGSIAIQGRIYEYTAGNTGNLGAGDAGRSASGVWNHYAYVSSGVIAIELSQTAPTRDTTYGYWTKTGDATRRMVGWHVTNTSNNIAEFWCTTVGRELTVEWDLDASIHRVSSTVPSNSAWTLVSCSSCLPASVISGKFNTKLGTTSSDADLTGFMSASNSAVLSLGQIAVRATFALASGTHYTFFGPIWIALKTNSIYNGMGQASGTMTNYLLDVSGGKMER